MKILAIDSSSIEKVVEQAVETLRAGGLVIYPTETTYGVAVDATNPSAVQKLLEYKGRRDGKPISIAVDSIEMAEHYVELNSQARLAYDRFLPGPVTVVSKGRGLVAAGVQTKDGSLGVRIPDHPIPIAITRALGKPITATGANASFQKRPYTVQDILDPLSEAQKQLLDLILDAGALPQNPPSTVIDTRLEDLQVLRQGAISFESAQEHLSHSPEDTIALGKQAISVYKSYLSHTPIVFLLKGEMGAGKTQFCKGIAQGLGIKQTVSSPTYQLAKEYRFVGEGKPLRFVHIDAWRMFAAEELDALGFRQMLEQEDVIAIEWADKLSDHLATLQDEAIVSWVQIDQGEEEHHRRVHIKHD